MMGIPKHHANSRIVDSVTPATAKLWKVNIVCSLRFWKKKPMPKIGLSLTNIFGKISKQNNEYNKTDIEANQ